MEHILLWAMFLLDNFLLRNAFPPFLRCVDAALHLYSNISTTVHKCDFAKLRFHLHKI